MHLGGDLVGFRHGLLTSLPRLRRQRPLKDRRQPRRAGQFREAGTVPFRIRRVDSLHQKAQQHHIADQPRGDHPRAEFVAHVARPPHERFFLRNPHPLRAQQIQPQVARVILQALTQRIQFAQAAVIDRARRQNAQFVLRKGQPVSGHDRTAVPFVSQLHAQQIGCGRNPDEVLYFAGLAFFESAAGFAGDRHKAGRVAAQAVGQAAPQRLIDGFGVTRQIVRRQEQPQTRPPTVIA